jgi:biopolymer transport protein ExbD
MKFRRSDQKGESIKLQMTPMIDIVFQLLIFFILTFKPPVYEGDFGIRMPAASQNPASALEDPLNNLYIRLRATDNVLASIDINDGDQVFSGREMYSDLHNYVRAQVEQQRSEPNGTEVEVEFDIDRGLYYEYTIKAIDAITGYVQDGRIAKLVEKIKFRDNSEINDLE